MTDFHTRAADQAAPHGFAPIRLDGFISANGPVFSRPSADGGIVLGCRVMSNMSNPMGVVHGGWVASLFDVAIPLNARRLVPELEDHFSVTISLTVDYLDGPRSGDWIEIHTRLLRRTKRMVFFGWLAESRRHACCVGQRRFQDRAAGRGKHKAV